jgi:hypothetical protein
MHRSRRFSAIAIALVFAACQNTTDPAGVPTISGDWVFNESMPGPSPEDECFVSGHIVFSQTATSFTGVVASHGPACGIPDSGVVQGLQVSRNSITFTFGTCQFSGALFGARPDSLGGAFSCSSPRGTGAWSAGRLGPAATLMLTNWPNHQRVVVGGTVSLGAVLKDSAGHTLSAPPFVWSSDNTGVLAVAGLNPDNGTVLVTAAGTGSATVSVTSSRFNASARFTVTQVRFASVSAGEDGSCGIGTTPLISCWGYPVGDSTNMGSSTPVPVLGDLAFASLSTGGGGGAGAYACGVTGGGAAYCWGTSPIAVSGALAFSSVSVGGNHTCGLTTAGAAYCWGYNWNGELGIGTASGPQQCNGYACSPTPVAVSGGLTFATVSAGARHSCGVTSAGLAYCWGANEDGQLGNGATTNRSTPVAVAGALKFSAVSAGGDHTCGVTTAGVAYCWGFNYYGELGTGSTTAPQQCSSFPCSTMPVAVTGGLAFVAVSAGEQHSCGVSTSSQAYCWGFNAFGQLGNGSTTDSSSPVAVGGFNFQSVSAGLGNHAHSCGLTTGGVAYCWGANYTGQLGNGSTTNSSTPVRVVGQP